MDDSTPCSMQFIHCPKKRRYSTFQQEDFAVIFCLQKFRHYLRSAPLVFYSHHQALKVAFGKSDIHGRLARCLNFIPEYEFEIRDLQGEKNVEVDYLSRSVEAAGSPSDEKYLWADQFLAINKGAGISKVSVMRHEHMEGDNKIARYE